jgi:hypothetical protein
MADQTISELTELNGAALAANDLLPIVDISSSETKNIRVDQLIQNGIALTADNNINLAKLNQASDVKLGTNAMASGSITASLLAANSAIAVQGSAPASDNFLGRGWYDNADGNLYIYSAGNYQQVVLPGAGILDGAIVTAKIANNTVTDQKIQSSGLSSSSIATGAITSAKIADVNVTTGKLADGAVTNTKIALSTIDSTRLAPGAADTSALANSGITSNKFTAGAVDTIALGPLSVTNAKIADATIEYAKLNLSSGSLPGSKIVNATISGLQIANEGVLTANLANEAVTGAKIANATISAGKFASSAIATADIADNAVTIDKIGDSAVGSDQLAASGITALKVASNSISIVQPNEPIGNGTFVGQQWLNSSTDHAYTWDGSAWNRHAAINSIAIEDSTPIAFAVTYPDFYSATITATLDNQNANAIFAGPASGAAATPTFRGLQASDIPVATSETAGGVMPGAGLQVSAGGVLAHDNSALAGTYAGPVTIDTEGHVVTALSLLRPSDIPDLDASKITTGQFSSTFLASNSVTADQLADYGIAQVTESFPTPEFAGQWWVNPSDRSASIWVGEVAPSLNGYWLNLGYGSPTQINLRFGGTYNASGNTVTSLNSYGIEAGLATGQPLSAPNTSSNGLYLIVTVAGTGTSPAPTESLSVGNWVLSQGVGSEWTRVALGSAIAGVADQDILVDGASLVPVAAGVATQEDLNEVTWARVQISTASTAGIVRASSEIAVASGTGIMSVGTVDDGTY